MERAEGEKERRREGEKEREREREREYPGTWIAGWEHRSQETGRRPAERRLLVFTPARLHPALPLPMLRVLLGSEQTSDRGLA